MIESDTSFLFQLMVILLAAGIGRFLAIKLKQPPVLGELISGMVLGNLWAFMIHPSVNSIAALGIFLLLFSWNMLYDIFCGYSCRSS